MRSRKSLSWPALPLEWIGHTDAINCISHSPDGYHIVTGSNDKTIRIWDAETGAGVGEPLMGHTDYVRSIAYSSDGRRIVSGSDDKTIRIWDAETLRFNICELDDSRLANADIEDLPSRIQRLISDTLQYSCLYWSNHLCFPPGDHDQRVLVLEGMKKFLEGPYPLFWIEVMSIMGMVPTTAPSLRRVISWVRVSTAPAYVLHPRRILIYCRMPI